MDLEQQVCSAELGSRLDNLGVLPKSHFVWGSGISRRVGLFTRTECHMPMQAPAFTVAELGEMLPALGGYGWHWSVQYEDGTWFCVRSVSSGNDKHRTSATTEADARAKMLIYLIENKLIEV